MARIQVLDLTTEVGIKVDNAFNCYPKAGLSVSSDANAIISILNNGDVVASGNTTDFIDPQEASVKDLILLIKPIITP